MTDEGHQLGDFIKGRFMFLEDYCRRNGRDAQEARDAIQEECLRLAETTERKEFIQKRLFGGVVLSSSVLPDWVDRIFLEAMSHVLKGPGAALVTRSSRMPCIASEAGRFNAMRQAETVFKLLYQRKSPGDWLKDSFPVLYRKCYGEEAGLRLKVEVEGPQRVRLTLDNRGLDKASALDCSTIVGYLFGSLEAIHAVGPVVTHTTCGVEGIIRGPCVYEVTWKAGTEV